MSVPKGTSITVRNRAYRNGTYRAQERDLAQECAVAISYNGTSHAVLMATPADLEDLARGFTLSEGIAGLDEIEAIAVVEGELGFDTQVSLASDAHARLEMRRRSMAGPVGCGMCGLENIEAAMRALEPVSSSVRIEAREIGAALTEMVARQELNRKTQAVHAAGCYVAGRGLAALREDVGRHNALDKLIGHCASAGHSLADSAIMMSSRLSVELVQKAASVNCGIIIAISAPTTLAIRQAEAAGMTLVAVARGEEFEVFTHPERIVVEDHRHVA